MTLRVSVVSAESELWQGDARQVTARTVDGEIGILTGHEPILAVLAGGEVKVATSTGDTVTVVADDGFLSVQGNTVQVVAGHAALQK